MHIQNLENKIILETYPKAKGMVVHNNFNINLIKFGRLDVTREKCFFSSSLVRSVERAVTLLILMRTFEWMT